MKNLCSNLGYKITQSILLKKNNTFTDQQILELQDIFLEPGIHYVQVDSFASGRLVIHHYLNALKCFDSPACFSLHTHEPNVTNIVEEVSPAQLLAYFELDFDADFLWVECDSGLLHYYPTVFLALEKYAAQQHIPIIIMLADGDE